MLVITKINGAAFTGTEGDFSVELAPVHANAVISGTLDVNWTQLATISTLDPIASNDRYTLTVNGVTLTSTMPTARR